MQLASCFQSRSIHLGSDNKGPEYKYAVFEPKDYASNPDRAWPLILFLHGSGECGTDGVKQTTIGLPPEIQRRADEFPFITLMPQAHGRWFTGENELAVWQMLDATIQEYRIDPDRIYITGLSMGGFATWDFIQKRPDVFAAAVPICGVGDARFVLNAQHLPIWAFHGAKDAAVPVSGSRDPIAALRNLGASPEYTEYSDGEHNVWDRVYRGKRIYEWMLKQKRRPAPSRIEYRMLQPAARIWWLQLRAEAGVKTPPLVSAEVKGSVVTLLTHGIDAWVIASAGEPIVPNAPIKLTWNKQVVFEGKFPGVLRILPPPTTDATTKPSAKAD